MDANANGAGGDAAAAEPEWVTCLLLAAGGVGLALTLGVIGLVLVLGPPGRPPSTPPAPPASGP